MGLGVGSRFGELDAVRPARLLLLGSVFAVGAQPLPISNSEMVDLGTLPTSI